MRMLQTGAGTMQAGGTGDRVPWLYCLVPEHMKDSLIMPSIWHTPVQRLRHITGVVFTDR